MHYKNILNNVDFGKKLLSLLRDFNQLYDEGYVKVLVTENRSIFSDILKFCLVNIL